MRTLAAAVVLLAASGCGGDDSLPEAVDPESTFSFRLLEAAEMETRDRRVAWRQPTGITVTAQRMPTSDATVRERTVDAVADAFVRRFEAGEVEGRMAKAPCRAGGRATTCTMGWIAMPPGEGGGRYVRRGVLVEVRDEIVLLEVLGPEAERERVDEQAELLERTLEVREG